MLKRISNTAAYGALTVGPKIIDEKVKDSVREALQNIKNGVFDKDWKNDYQSGYPNFNRLLKELEESQAEVVGNRIRGKIRLREGDGFKVKNV